MTGAARSLDAALRQAVIAALARHGYFSNEDGRACGEDKIDLQRALVEQLGDCERELDATFTDAALPPPDPPPEMGPAKDVCATRGRLRKVDLLWRIEGRLVAIEVKLRRITNWSRKFEDGSALTPRKPVDAYGYTVLKDIHRLERLVTVTSSGGPVLPTDRFVMFLTNDPYEYEARIPHANLKLSHGRVLEPGHLVQFNLTKPGGAPTSPNTLWRDYSPFHLAGRYEVEWENLADDVARFTPTPPTTVPYPTSRLLLLRVQPQDPSA